MKMNIYNDGTRSLYMPVWAERNQYIQEAEGCIATIKKNLRKQSKEFNEDVWLHDRNVIRYRKLLRKIWDYVVTQWVVDTIDCCDKCYAEQSDTTELYRIEFDWHYEKNTYHSDQLVCKKCLNFEEWKISKSSEFKYENISVKKL